MIKLEQHLRVAFLLVSMVAVGAGAHAVNVKEQWCKNRCTEGHDSGQCICVRTAGAPAWEESSWIDCFTLPCCSQPIVACGNESSDVVWNDHWPRGSVPTVPSGYAGNFDFCQKWYDYDWLLTGNCSYDHHCQYLDDIGCWIPPGESTCTYYAGWGTQSPTYYNVQPGQCARSNETGFWSWASWWSFFSGADTCSLGWQTPWTKSGVNEACN